MYVSVSPARAVSCLMCPTDGETGNVDGLSLYIYALLEHYLLRLGVARLRCILGQIPGLAASSPFAAVQSLLLQMLKHRVVDHRRSTRLLKTFHIR